jgi:hypothetical protein
MVPAATVRGATPTPAQPAPAIPTTAPPGMTNGPLVYQNLAGQIAVAALGTTPKSAALAAPSSFPLAGSTPAWSPSGLRLAFSRRVAGGHTQIFLADSDGTEVRQLTHDPAGAAQPTWSPNGLTIAFTSTLDGGRPQIYTINVTGTDERRLTDDPAGATEPAWSPTGPEVAFVSARTGGFEIWRINADGSGLRQVTTSSTRAIDPAWAPSGTTIAFAAQAGRGSSIFTIYADGAGLRRRTDQPGANDRFPSFSPTGDGIAFTRTTTTGRSTWLLRTAPGAPPPNLLIPNATRADWGALAVPPANPVLLGQSVVAVVPRSGAPPQAGPVRLSAPQASVQTPLATQGARVPEGFTVHAPAASPVELAANVAGRATPAQTVRAVVSGTFQLVPAAGDPTALTLRIPSLPGCPVAIGGAAAARRTKRKPAPRRVVRVRHLEGRGARVRVVAGDSYASSVDTTWMTTVTCDGTLTTVNQGVVSVLDTATGTTVRVAAPNRYFVPVRP